jgi:hypothetical protein
LCCGGITVVEATIAMSAQERDRLLAIEAT